MISKDFFYSFRGVEYGIDEREKYIAQTYLPRFEIIKHFFRTNT